MTERDPLAQIRSQTAAVIPAYQDEKHIGDIVRRTRERLDYVLVVDDGSSDQTAQRAREAGAEVIVHNQNRGKGEAIKTGLGYWFATANPSRRTASGLDREVMWVSLLDSDGQHLPEEIDRFLAAAACATQPTFLIGNRMNNLAGMPFIRRVVNRYMSSQISRLCGQEIPDTQCGFRMVDRQLVPELLSGGNRFEYETEVLIIASRRGYKIESVPITTVYSDQVSKIHPMRDALRFLKLMWRYRKTRTPMMRTSNTGPICIAILWWLGITASGEQKTISQAGVSLTYDTAAFSKVEIVELQKQPLPHPRDQLNVHPANLLFLFSVGSEHVGAIKLFPLGDKSVQDLDAAYPELSERAETLVQLLHDRPALPQRHPSGRPKEIPTIQNQMAGSIS